MTDNAIEWHVPNAVFDGQSLCGGFAIGVRDDVVSELRLAADIPPEGMITRYDGLLVPGFFDIQVNGGGGVLLNADPSLTGVETIAAAHRALGTTALCPTVISDHPDVTAAAAEACLAARERPGIMGIHIEGPHLSHLKRGTHKSEVLRDMDSVTLDLVAHLRQSDFPVLITVAPEAITPAQIERLVEMGAIVSIGHSNATAEEVEACLKAGARCFTHLFNAMSPMLGRAPGVVGAAIASDMWCSIIADGIHVDPKMVALAFRARPKADRMIAISDAMPTVGGADRFELYGKRMQLSKGRLINDEGSLAGAHLTMLDAVRNLVGYGIPKETALRSARANPAELMGLGAQMRLIGSGAGDILHLSPDLDLISVGLSQTVTA